MEVTNKVPHEELIPVLQANNTKYFINERNILIMEHKGAEFWLHKYTRRELEQFFSENSSSKTLDIVEVNAIDFRLDDISKPLIIFQPYQECIIYAPYIDKHSNNTSLCSFKFQAITVEGALRCVHAEQQSIEAKALVEAFYPVKKTKRASYWSTISKLSESVKGAKSVDVIWDYQGITGYHEGAAGSIKY